MKKVLSMILVLMLMLTFVVGCSQDTTTEETPEEETPVEETPVAAGEIAKLGLGQITTIGKSKDLNTAEDVTPVGQVDTIMAAVGFDQDGKVVSVTIDNAQTKVNFDADLQVTSDVTAAYETKVELGEEYGMIKASSIEKEWFEQMAELEKWMVGKTMDEIKAMKTVEKDENHPAVPDDAELTSLVTVSVEGYIAAVEEAFETAVEIGGGAVTVGLGHEVGMGKSKGLDAANDQLPLAQVDTIMAATAFDADGKVVATTIDNAQTKVTFDADGKVTADKAAEYKTKVELGEDYGMIKASSIKKEWFEQAAALGEWMAGKSIDEIKAMKVVAKDDAHPAVPDEAELTSSVTVSVEDYIAAVEESAANAK